MSAHAASTLGAWSSAMTRNALLAPRPSRVAARGSRRISGVTRATLPGARAGHFRAPKFARNLGEWSEGADVRQLQQALGTMRQDGVFGAETVAAVRLWQRANGIDATGYFGSQSRASWVKTNGGVRPAWSSTAIMVAAPGVQMKATSSLDFTGPALLGGFVLAAILKAQGDPLGFVGVFVHAAGKFSQMWAKIQNAFKELMFGDANVLMAGAPAILETLAKDVSVLVSFQKETSQDDAWAEYSAETETRVWGWGTPGFKEAREKRRAALEVDFAHSMRGPSVASDTFATLEYSDFVRAQATSDPETRELRREELDKKFRERRGLDAVVATEAMTLMQSNNTGTTSSNNVVPPPPPIRKRANLTPVPMDVSAPVMCSEKTKTHAKTFNKPRPVPPGVVPASSPSAMAAYEKLVQAMEAAEEAAAEKAGPR